MLREDQSTRDYNCRFVPPNTDIPARWANEGRQLQLSQWIRRKQLATAIFENMKYICECIVTSSNLHFNAICKVKPQNCVDKLLATTANSVLCLCVMFTGSETEEAESLPQVNSIKLSHSKPKQTC